jgi:hypothetical protein
VSITSTTSCAPSFWVSGNRNADLDVSRIGREGGALRRIAVN